MYIPRTIEPLVKESLFKSKVVIIYGPRQVGKTTLVKKIAHDLNLPFIYLNCDESEVRNVLAGGDSSVKLKQLIGDSKLIILDEAQRIKDIGLKLKLLIDNFPDQQVVATGSSSFELANEVVEPLTGRNIPFWLYPFSLRELTFIWDRLTLLQNLEQLMIYGSYPSIILAKTLVEKEKNIKLLASDNLYRDIVKFQSLKNSQTVHKLLSALALQTGNEVSYLEVGELIGTSRQTAESYVEILEKSFILFKTLPFSRNLRKEVGKMRKVYFWDNGIRNAAIDSFQPLSLRLDTGALWENFIIGEIKKRQVDILHSHNLHFWRTYDQQEIDLVEAVDGRLRATEIKWQKLKKSPPKAWIESYKDYSWTSVNKDNYLDYLLEKK